MENKFAYIDEDANVGPVEVFKDEMAPYLEIAKLNKLEKEKPDDDTSMVWIDHRNGAPQRLVLTRKGFISAIQYDQNVKIQEQGKIIEHLKRTITNLEKDTSFPESLGAATSELIGRRTRKNITSVLNGSMTDVEKLAEIKFIIKKK